MKSKTLVNGHTLQSSENSEPVEARDEFEAWAKSQDMDIYINSRRQYATTLTQGAWKGWQAALAHASKQTGGGE